MTTTPKPQLIVIPESGLSALVFYSRWDVLSFTWWLFKRIFFSAPYIFVMRGPPKVETYGGEEPEHDFYKTEYDGN